MEGRKEEAINNLIEDRLIVLKNRKIQLEKQITESTAGDADLQDAYLEHRREKLAEIIKEIKALESDEGIYISGNEE